MKKISNTTVFFGSGPVAAQCLEKLLRHTMVEAVVTKPRPPHHRGLVPVIEVAKKHNLPIITASHKQELTTVIKKSHFSSTYAILIDFGIIVEADVIDQFELGIINSHFSLLPALRGADPISFAILEGLEKTGVSLMCIDEGMDTGKLITSRTLSIEKDDTTPSLTAKLIDLSDQLIKEYVPRYLAGEVKPKNQPHPERATYSRKLSKQDGVLDWNKPALQLEREIRAFYEWPKSRGKIGSLEVIIRKAHSIPTDFGTPGEYSISNTSVLSIQTGKGHLCIDRIQPIGKKEMPITAFLAGYSSQL